MLSCFIWTDDWLVYRQWFTLCCMAGAQLSEVFGKQIALNFTAHSVAGSNSSGRKFDENPCTVCRQRYAVESACLHWLYKSDTITRGTVVMITVSVWLIACIENACAHILLLSFMLCAINFVFLYLSNSPMWNIVIAVCVIVVGWKTFPVEKPVEPFTVAWEFFRARHGSLDREPEESTQLWPEDSICCRQW